MIKENVRKLLDELPPGVELVAAAKTRTPDEIQEAIDAGVNIIGQNYVQEAQAAFRVIGNRARWHFIGHLQKNKAKKAVEIFDMIETVDSYGLAAELNKRCQARSKVLSILIEINSGRESQKFGVVPEEAEKFIKQIASFEGIKVRGLMTMGPMFGAPENARSYFQETRRTYERIKSLDIPNVEMKYLSMGMTNSFRVAIEEGANIVRIGTLIFGPR
ncbi:MAG TPA: YggS family pyridoxal phosphate-dependent enzyme [Candidatus Heimdallarchaeota archaeon]|nr:YggS family pyridoxal phosphate-dependent enzyme [Candidatus Heimdallarchaeota archaeon]